jgi:hypothetical protein
MSDIPSTPATPAPADQAMATERPSIAERAAAVRPTVAPGPGALFSDPPPVTPAAESLPWIETRSSNIHAMALRKAPEGLFESELFIRFGSGKAYRYTGPDVARFYNEMIAADSVGRYFGANVRHDQGTTCDEVDPVTGAVLPKAPPTGKGGF